jgi:Carbohydrate/starch-binding module (family 21)
MALRNCVCFLSLDRIFTVHACDFFADFHGGFKLQLLMCTMPHTTSAELPACFYSDAEASNTSRSVYTPASSSDVVSDEVTTVKYDHSTVIEEAQPLSKFAANDISEDCFVPPSPWNNVITEQCDGCLTKREVDASLFRVTNGFAPHSILVMRGHGDELSSRANSSDSGIASDCTDDDLGCRTEPTTPTTDDEPESNGTRKRRASYGRRVSFADDRQGGHLEEVIVYDPSVVDGVEVDTYACSPHNLEEDGDSGLAFSFDCHHYGGFHSLAAISCPPSRRLEPLFPPPWSNPTMLLAQFQRDSVVLETLAVTYASSAAAVDRQPSAVISGTVLVANLAYEKRVFARCTFDGWRSFVDVNATYAGRAPIGVPSTSDGHLQVTDADKFAFSIDVPPPAEQSDDSDDNAVFDDGVCGRRCDGRSTAVELAVCYEARCADGWRSLWDNNGNVNYSLDYVHSDAIW